MKVYITTSKDGNIQSVWNVEPVWDNEIESWASSEKNAILLTSNDCDDIMFKDVKPGECKKFECKEIN